MIDNTSYASNVADELSLTSSAYAEDVTDAVGLTSAAYAEDVAEAANDHQVGTIRILQFNIGHFNMGTQPAPTGDNPSSDTVLISSAKNDGWVASPKTVDRNYAVQLQRWEDIISGIDADIIGIEEYNKYFGWNNGVAIELTDTDIFDGYNLSVGRMGQSLYNGSVLTRGWQQNALASRFRMSNTGDRELGSSGHNIAKCYARYATVNINGKQVVIASTHLNWAQNNDAVASRTTEIEALISWLENEPYVILMGDFNTNGIYKASGKTEQEYFDGVNDFDPFLEAAFTLANHGAWGDFKTSPATYARPDSNFQVPTSCLDNIIVKGFSMSNVQVLDMAALGPNTVDVGSITDHCGIMCDLTLID